ncbi:MAG: kinase [Thermoleophilaceae bacterium]|nr:kinase [Thermoleophilaceae bacterium]MEA2457726.1 kinase [Thermoleophilaceae bacterium]
MSEKPRTITVLTHQYPEETADAISRLIHYVTGSGVRVLLSEDEADKHGIAASEGVEVGGDPDADTDLALVLGGDGTILTALRRFAGRKAPVFAINYGAIGFLSTIDHGGLEEGMQRALSGEFELLPMPALSTDVGGARKLGVNDISFHRRANGRVAELEYMVQGETLGRVRCDGLVVSTPVGSTGYNLANGGPVLAWGVEGFVVSFIAPHTLTARALVVAPGDVLTVENTSDRDEVDVSTDGRRVGELGPGQRVDVCFSDDEVLLAQVPGSTFYHRFREKFGRLAT